MKGYLWSIVIFTFTSCTKVKDDSHGMSNEDFVIHASMVNSAGTDIGALAATRATNEGIKDLAQIMTEYHRAAQSQLKSLVINLNLSIPDSLDAEHASLRNQLLDLSGAAFDSVYIRHVVIDYQRAIDLFLEEMITGENEQLRDYSSANLLNLQSYLQRADSLARQY